MLNPDAEIASWVAKTFGLVVAVCAATWVTGLPAILLISAAPAVAAIAVMGAVGTSRVLHFRRISRSGLRISILGPMVVQMAGLLLVIRLDLVTWRVAPFAGPDFYEQAILLVGGAVFTALAEEMAFSGFLLPRLIRFGVVKAVLILGLAHGLWRLPLIVAFGTPLAIHSPIGLPLVVLTFTLGSAFQGLLRLISKSIWLSALAQTIAMLGWAAITGLTTANLPWAFDYSAAAMIFVLLFLNVLAVLMLLPEHTPTSSGAT